MNVFAAIEDLLRNPYDHLIRRWNWKSAVTSAVIRGLIFLLVTLPAGRAAAAGAMIAETLYRAATSGFFGAITQRLSKVKPDWVAAVAAMLVLPILNHVGEFAVHWMRGTPRLAVNIGASVAFTIISTLFNLYIQKQGVLLVGEEKSLTLWEDLATIPRMIAGFVTLPFRWFLSRDL